MDDDLRRQMLVYYDARAFEYEEAYTLGTGTSSIRDPSAITTEARLLSSIVTRCVSGRVIDIACGTAFWLPHYESACSHVTVTSCRARRDYGAVRSWPYGDGCIAVM